MESPRALTGAQRAVPVACRMPIGGSEGVPLHSATYFDRGAMVACLALRLPTLLLLLLLLLTTPRQSCHASSSSLDGLDLKWWIASKLALPAIPARPSQLACVRSQINCSSPTEYVLANFTYPYGLGSCLLAKLSLFLADAAVAKYGARPLMYQWQVRKVGLSAVLTARG